jgi:Icc-related predicted phosphoesterase
LIEKEVFIKASLFKDINYLCDEELIIDGIKFYGTPYQPIFYHWAFNLDEENLKEKWAKIPSDTDVLLTHCPPKGILDSGFGSESLLLKINELKLKLHVFGHIHNPYGVTGKTINGNNTIFANASVVNQQYLPVNKPIIVNI